MVNLKVKTDQPELLAVFREAGFEVDGNVINLNDDENLSEKLQLVVEILRKRQIDTLDPNLTGAIVDDIGLGEKDEINNESEVEYFEKMIKGENGEDIVVRLAITKQDPLENQYSRLVNISYLNKETGEKVVSDQVFAYEDASDFDKNVVPQIIDGFHKEVSLNGRRVDVDEANPTKTYFATDNGSGEYVEGYNVNYRDSLLDSDRENNLVGDQDNKVNLSQLEEDNIVKRDVEPGETFEESVTDTREVDIDEESLEYDGRQKTIGTYPTSNAGISNWMGIALFLTIDVVAIIVGIYLLLM